MFYNYLSKNVKKLAKTSPQLTEIGPKMLEIIKKWSTNVNKAFVSLGSCNKVQTERLIFKYANWPRLQIKNWSVLLVHQAGWTSWPDQLDTPAGQTSWTDQLDGSAGQTSWTDQLDTPAGRISWMYQFSLFEALASCQAQSNSQLSWTG